MQFRSEEHTSELQSQSNLVCRLLLEKKKKIQVEMTSVVDKQVGSGAIVRDLAHVRSRHLVRVYSLCVSLFSFFLFFFFFFKYTGPPQIFPLSPPRPFPN